MPVNFLYSRLVCNIIAQNNLKNRIYFYCTRNITTIRNKSTNNETTLVKIDAFENIANRNKETYLDMVKIFEHRDIHRRGHVEFIYSALKHMESFGVHKDLEVYKSLIDILPKGKFIPTNIFQAEFMHYPKQQQCAIDLLQQMEDNGVIPDFEMEDQLMNVFGRRGYALRKYWRMMYWMPKFKNLSPWPLPNPLPNDNFEIAKLAVVRISSVDLNSEVTVFKTLDIPDALDDTWIISAQSPVQINLLKDHDLSKPIYVEGAFRIWIRNVPVNYFILRTDAPDLKEGGVKDEDDVSNLAVPSTILNISEPESLVTKERTIHEQEDGIILAVCASGTSSRDSLLSWIRHLEKSNRNLGKAVVVFSSKSPSTEDEEVEELSSAEKKKIEHQ